MKRMIISGLIGNFFLLVALAATFSEKPNLNVVGLAELIVLICIVIFYFGARAYRRSKKDAQKNG